MIKAVIFDFGGVFFTSWVPVFYSFEKLSSLPKERKKELMHGEMWKKLKYDEIDEDEYWNYIKKEVNLDVSIKELGRKLRETIKEKPEMNEIVKKLREKCNVFILSNHVRNWIDYCENKYHFKELFDKVYFSFDYHMDKPGREFFNLLFNETRLKPEECVFVDDADYNIKAAKKLGMKCIKFESSNQFKEEMSKLGVEI